MASAVLRMLWPQSIPLRICRLLILGSATLTLLKRMHTDGKIDLGYLYTIIQRRDKIVTAILNATYRPITPVLAQSIWGEFMNIAMDPNPDVLFPSPLNFAAIAIVTAGSWVWWGCFPYDGKGFMAQLTRTRGRGEAIYTSFLMLGLMLATWTG